MQCEPHPGFVVAQVCGESRKTPRVGLGPAVGPALDFPGPAVAGGGGGGMLLP